MNKRTIIITSAGLVIGLGEALIYYNQAKNEDNRKTKIYFPKGVEFGKMVGLVLFTAVLTAGLSNLIEKNLPQNNVKPILA